MKTRHGGFWGNQMFLLSVVKERLWRTAAGYHEVNKWDFPVVHHLHGEWLIVTEADNQRSCGLHGIATANRMLAEGLVLASMAAEDIQC